MPFNIKVDVNTDGITSYITINDQRILDISQIISIFGNNPTVGDFNTMKTEQQVLNYLDSIKDGANKFALHALKVYPLVSPDNPPIFPSDLKLIENTVETAYSQSISNITWTKMKKKQELNSPLPI